MVRKFDVWITNMMGCALGISDISWSTTVTACTEAEALELALNQAKIINQESGLPPHGIRVNEDRLRQMAYVIPKQTA